MSWVDPKIAEKVAKMPETHAAVIKVRDRLAVVAEGEFASHDRPGGHEITKDDERIDALVSLEGPDPLAVEFGHWGFRDATGRFVKTGSADTVTRDYIEGLHILGRAVAQVEAEGRL